MAIVEETELLSADGTGSHLLGLIPQATAYAATFAPTLSTGIDTIGQAILLSELSLLPASFIVLHPTDWWKIKELKTTVGEYILGNPAATTAPSLWGLPVIATPAIAAGTFLVGSDLAAQIFDRMEVEILISTEHDKNFTVNEVTVRAEQRLALCVKRPAALIYGAFP